MGRGTYRVAALGDIMLTRSVGERFAQRPEDFACSEIAELLRGYDLVFANLETTVSTRGRRHPVQDPNVAFRSHPRLLMETFTRPRLVSRSSLNRPEDRLSCSTWSTLIQSISSTTCFPGC